MGGFSVGHRCGMPGVGVQGRSELWTCSSSASTVLTQRHHCPSAYRLLPCESQTQKDTRSRARVPPHRQRRDPLLASDGHVFSNPMNCSLVTPKTRMKPHPDRRTPKPHDCDWGLGLRQNLQEKTCIMLSVGICKTEGWSTADYQRTGDCDRDPVPDVKSTGLIWERASQKEQRKTGRADNLDLGS